MRKINFIHILAITAFFFTLLTYLYYTKTRENAINNAQSKVNELLLNYQALRMNVSKRQKKELYHLQETQKVDKEYFSSILLSSTYNAKQVNNYYNELRRKQHKKPIIIRFASDHPRNPRNKANEKESMILKKFNNKEIIHYTEIIEQNNSKILFDAIPTKTTTKKCMKCHSDPSIAPKGLIEIYGDKNGFHEQVGRIRAILTTSYPLDEDLKAANLNFLILTIITFVFFAINITILYFFMKRISLSNKKLDKQVLVRTKELEEEKEYIETIIESNNNAIIAINWTGTITTYNSKAQEMFGWTKEEMIGTRNILNIIPEKYKELHTEALFKYLKTGKLKGTLDKALQSEGQNKDGVIFPIRISIGTKFNYQDTVIIANISDITQEKKHEDIINQQSKLVAMGEMIGNIAHQWRQPLSVISTAATGMKIKKEYGLLEEGEFEEVCDSINDNAQYLSATIDDFRDFIKGDKTKKVFSLESEFDSFLHLIDGAVKSHHIQVVLDLEKGIKVDSYQNELTQCLINIFNNAKDALKDIEEENRYVFISTIKQDDKVIIKLKDNAGGIPEDILPKIFEPYFTTKHQSQGTGLGLHMTYNLIVDGMNGAVEAKNRKFSYNNIKYKGAEFIITL